MATPGGHPSEGLALQTPPQAGASQPVVVKFYDPKKSERHTTRENIQKFFDPNTYKMLDSPCAPSTLHTGQKRSAPDGSPMGAPPASKPKTMTKEQLLTNFKLAAELNGIEWGAMVVTRPVFIYHISICISIYEDVDEYAYIWV